MKIPKRERNVETAIRGGETRGLERPRGRREEKLAKRGEEGGGGGPSAAGSGISGLALSLSLSLRWRV